LRRETLERNTPLSTNLRKIQGKTPRRILQGRMILRRTQWRKKTLRKIQRKTLMRNP